MLQSIYTHAGCDEIGHPVWTLFDVSIHTPTQGVTGYSNWRGCFERVSIHTPTQGVTITAIEKFSKWMFQSTHPRRVWRCCCVISSSSYQFQSTHPRRVWHVLPFGLSQAVVSIHTPTQGVTLNSSTESLLGMFQSTHPRRVWPIKQQTTMNSLCFNPHTHAGCDLYQCRNWQNER